MAETEMIEVVIKMPKEKYDSICNMYGTFPTEMKEWGLEYIKNGTVLPEGHGRIADIDKVLEEMKATRTYDIPFALERVKPIVEEDTQNKEKENKEKEDIMPYITGATLLSVEEAKNLDKEILKADEDWWLGSGGRYIFDATCVNGGHGYVYDYGHRVNHSFGVRPVLEISDLGSSGYKIGESVSFGDHSFTVISEKYALCDDIIGECVFRKDLNANNANDYGESDVKKFVDDWFAKAKEQAKDTDKVQDEDEREL
ncbi:MAG: hypothetical protein IKM88_00945 [Lachnospiraceae bacterium]|nr:hypothetical protein [Lachnospiraceae bacterium]MBR3735957.1 hypothetical protein [Lachnospiraceae bacterium]MBR6848789.1 hypothetical protein [Lachnospiraceae bacterium]